MLYAAPLQWELYLQKGVRHRVCTCSHGEHLKRLFPLQCTFWSTFFYMLNIKIIEYNCSCYWGATSEQNWGPLVLFITKWHSRLKIDPAEKTAEFPKCFIWFLLWPCPGRPLCIPLVSKRLCISTNVTHEVKSLCTATAGQVWKCFSFASLAHRFRGFK